VFWKLLGQSADFTFSLSFGAVFVLILHFGSRFNFRRGGRGSADDGGESYNSSAEVHGISFWVCRIGLYLCVRTIFNSLFPLLSFSAFVLVEPLPLFWMASIEICPVKNMGGVIFRLKGSHIIAMLLVIQLLFLCKFFDHLWLG